MLKGTVYLTKSTPGSSMRKEILAMKMQDIKVVYIHCKVYSSLWHKVKTVVFILKIKRLFKNDSYSYRYIRTYPGYLAKSSIYNLYFPHKIPTGFSAFTTCLKSGFILRTKPSKFRTET